MLPATERRCANGIGVQGALHGVDSLQSDNSMHTPVAYGSHMAATGMIHIAGLQVESFQATIVSIGAIH
jgi:hypothetical protein